MKVKQEHFVNHVWKPLPNHALNGEEKYHLVLAFGAGAAITAPEVYSHLRDNYPEADIVFASTSGEILGDSVFDDSVVVTAIAFEKTRIKCVKTTVNSESNSYETGKLLMESLNSDDLCNIFIVSDGTFINGSELVAGFEDQNSRQVPLTGGLAGDAARFSQTYTGLNEVPTPGNVVAIGFYGSDLRVGHGSFGGWVEFGQERTVTRSDKNVLYEIDGNNALDLYKHYLGDYVNELPGSALLFPLSLKISGAEKNLVRTILSVNETDKSMTFAGNLPEGSKVRLMKANFDKLIEASSTAASNSFDETLPEAPDLAILVSCVGRKLILQERTDEEIHAAKEALGERTAISGFYSYGEISPFGTGSQCELHNQTMTITSLTEL